MNKVKETFIDLQRDIDHDHDENLEEQLERQWEQAVDTRRFESELLFSAQGLGIKDKVETPTGQEEIYIKGDHCEASLKDLCRFVKKDQTLMTRLCLAKWKSFEDDLYYLLIGYPQDKVLSYYVVILIEALTNSSALEQTSKVHERDEILRALQKYKLLFQKPTVFETLRNHLIECVQGELKVHIQMVELIIMIIRNLLQIPDEEKTVSETNKTLLQNLHKGLIETFLNEKEVITALIYISQDFSSPSRKKLAPLFVEIFYYIFTGFDPEWLLRSEDEELIIQRRINQHNQARRHKEQSQIPARHSRFGGIKQIMRKFDTSSQLKNTLNQNQIDTNTNPHQRHKPVLRALVQKHKTIFLKRIYLTSDLNQDKKTLLCGHAIDFMQHCFSRLIDAVFDDIQKDSEILDPDDKIHYFVLVAYFLKFTRLYCKRNTDEKVKLNELSSELMYVAAALQITSFELIYSNLLRESTQNKKKMFNYRNYFAAITTLMEFLYVVRDLSLSTQSIDRKNAQILMQNIFSHDISRVLRVGFSYCSLGLFQDVMLKVLIETTSLFFDLLESYSRGKTLTIKTNKILKRKIKKIKKNRNKQNQEGEEDNEDQMLSQHEDENQRDQEDQEDDEDDDDDDEPLYKERKFNLMSEFAIVVEYTVVDKIFHLISGDQILTNPIELNTAIYKYFQRIIDLLQADWLFFQIHYLSIINSILKKTEITIRNEHRPLVQILRRISRSFIQILQKNPLIGVEILFRFPDARTKDEILNNYPDEVDQGLMSPTTQEQNHKEFSQEKQSQYNTWTRQEDEELIRNYERFKHSENPFESLCQYLASLGFTLRNPKEIKKRIKKYQLQDGINTAFAKFQETYERMALRKEEAMKQSLRELTQKQDFLNFLSELKDQIIYYVEERGAETFEMPLPPTNNIQFDYFADQNFQILLQCLELRPPGQGQIYWRILPSIDRLCIERWYDELIKIGQESQIQETFPQSTIEPTPYDEQNYLNNKQIYQNRKEENQRDEYDDIFN